MNILTENPASTGMTGDVTITNDHDNTVILNEQTLPKVVDSSTNEQIKEKINCTLCTNPNSEFMIQCFFCKDRLHDTCTNLPSYELSRYIKCKSR